MRPLSLLFAIHNHQPDGNFGHVFEAAYRDCYAPIVDMLLEFPRVHVSLHHTGALFEWIEREQPQYFKKLRALVERGQVELLGGGFYEPMLAVLPERDALGQIEMMSNYLAKHFGTRPTGMWLAERVWEPHLAKLISDAGLKYTLVDDGHFRAAGVEGLLRGYYVTEKAGAPLAIFPIDKQLRDAIPFAHAWETMQTLERLADESPLDGVTYGDDGEKFGVWPRTKEWVWEKGWLREFFQLLSTAGDRILTQTHGEFLRTHRPTGRIYLPTASYEEMGEWALPADAQIQYLQVRAALSERGELERARPFVRGGIWQGFLAKYPEANFMHKKMILVSDKIAMAAEVADDSAIENARRELYRAQCNCCYWHGLFGGLYLNYLRDAVYHHLIEAESVADRLLNRGPQTIAADLDADLETEILLSDGELAAYIKPSYGGGIYELDYKPKRFNLVNVLGRHAEGYHPRLREAAGRAQNNDGGVKSIHDLSEVKSAGLENLLVADRHLRLTFLDHFFGAATSLEDLRNRSYLEEGDFVDGNYQIIGSEGAAVLQRDGIVAGKPVRVEKKIALGAGEISCEYRISSPELLTIHFASELSLTLLAGDAPDRYYRVTGQTLSTDDRKLISSGEVDGPLEMVNEWDQFFVRIRCAPHAPIWRYPLEAASQSEGGFERTYQGSVILPFWRGVEIGAGRDFVATVTIETRPLDAPRKD